MDSLGADPTRPLRAVRNDEAAPPIQESSVNELFGTFRMISDALIAFADQMMKIDWERLRELSVQAEEAKHRWEADHPGVPYGTDCMCLCGLYKHIGSCTGYAEVARGQIDLPEPLFLCKPCEELMLARSQGR